MDRIDIINQLLAWNSFNDYLEIGVRNPKDCFDKIQAKNKTGVDPGFERFKNKWKYDYEMTSDEFFINLERGSTRLPSGKQWDIIFIDGLHTGQQVYLDVQNAIRHLSPKGLIVLHDCNPPSVYHAREDYQDLRTPAGGAWNGTVWKAVQRLRQECKIGDVDFNLLTIDTDWGVGIIKPGQWGTKFPSYFNPFFDYNVFRTRRQEILNLIGPEQFLAMKTFFAP